MKVTRCAIVLRDPKVIKKASHPTSSTNFLPPSIPLTDEIAKAEKSIPYIAAPFIAPKKFETAEGIMENVPPNVKKIPKVASVNSPREEANFEYKNKNAD